MHTEGLMSDLISEPSEMFRPPVDRAMRVLDRPFFSKRILLSAARPCDNSKISGLQRTLSQEILRADRVPGVQPSPLPEDVSLKRKAILLKPEIRPSESNTWSDTLLDLVRGNLVSVIPFEMTLDYNHWTYNDIMEAILPLDELDEVPSGFAVIGHVAHLNLRDQYLPYKSLIAQVIVDKNPAIKTVINKVDDVGSENEFRTFKYELLNGDPSLQVEIRELDCTFRFDYSQVYWNSRLNTEHERLVDAFRPGEAVCDVMAGVGPFAVPAAKRKIFVWANDLNPASYEAMVDARVRNKVSDHLRTFNMDGRQFIRHSAQALLKEEHKVTIRPREGKKSSSRTALKQPPQPLVVMEQPQTFQHYVMNLPATATRFLDAFIGLYQGLEGVFEPSTGRKLPLVHVYCFSTKSEDNKKEEGEICEEISQRLQHPMRLGENELVIRDVRDVAPKKRMFCASFRLPEAVAFRRVV